MNTHFCNVTQYGNWSSAQSANGDGVRYSNLTFMCFALAGSQFSLGTPASLPRDQVVGNPLSLYSRYLAPQAQHAPSAHDETIIPALKNIQDDKPKEKEKQPLPSLFDGGILQPFEVGAGNELKPKTSPPMTRTTRRTFRLAAYVIPEVYEPPSDDVLEPEGSSPGSAAVNTSTQSTLLLYDQRGQAARVLPRLPSSAVYERVRQLLRFQANQELSGTSPRTTRLLLQYLARLPSRL
jgi:hypothetical protein